MWQLYLKPEFRLLLNAAEKKAGDIFVLHIRLKHLPVLISF